MGEARATAKNLRISAQKARLVLSAVRHLEVNQALRYLNYSPKKAAVFVKKVLESAIANAEFNHGLDVDALKILTLYADEGRVMKRWRARARGRSAKILKRTCHITVILSDSVKR